MFWTNRDSRGHPGGRRAGCPHPAGPCGDAKAPFLKLPRCGGRERPPYGTGEAWRPTGQPRPRVITNLCRGRCLHCARRRVSEANRAAGPALRPEIVPRTLRHRKVPGRDKSRPYKPSEMPRQTGRPQNHPGVRRAGCPHPAGPCGGTSVCGRIWNPPLRSMVGYATNRETATLSHRKPM